MIIIQFNLLSTSTSITKTSRWTSTGSPSAPSVAGLWAWSQGWSEWTLTKLDFDDISRILTNISSPSSPVVGGFITDKLQARFGLHSRLWVQSGFLILATPFAALTLYLEPPYCFIALALYYFFAETWFAILFTVIVEIVPSNTRGLCTAVFLCVMNIIAGKICTLTSHYTLGC